MAERGQSTRNRSAANSGRIPFAPAYVAELYDSRLSSDEKILLWKIRYRAGVKGATWISWETMAEESDKSRATMMRQIKKLRDLGFLTTEARGFGQTTDKVVECPTELYPQDLCDSHTVGKYFRRDRDPEILQELLSANLSSLIGETTGDKDDGQAPRKSHQRDSLGLTSETNEVSPVRLELDKSKLDKSKLDPSPFGLRETQQAGSHGGAPDGEDKDLDPQPPFVDVLGNGEEGESDPRLAKARELQTSKSRETYEKARDKFEDRRAAKAERDASGATEEYARVRKELAEDNRKPSYKMGVFFEPVFRNNFPHDHFTTWMQKEYSQANKLLEKYSDDLDLICEVWVFVCENWDEVRRKIKLTEGYPTIGLMLGLHSRIFPMVSKSKSKRRDVESRQPKDDFGWR